GAGPCFRDAGPGSKAKPSAPQVTIVSPHIPRPTPVGDSPSLPRRAGYRTPSPAKAQHATKCYVFPSLLIPRPSRVGRPLSTDDGWTGLVDIVPLVWNAAPS